MGALIYDHTVTTAVTQLDITGLSLEKGELYEMVATMVGGSGNHRLFANNNVTTANYYSQWLEASGTYIAGYRYNENYIGIIGATNYIFKAFIKLTNDGHYVISEKSTTSHGATSPGIYDVVMTSTFTMTNITSLQLNAINANGIGINSRIQLYKVAEKVDEVIVAGSSVTQVDFTGLDIGKGNEYLLVSDVFNGGTSEDANIYFNNDTTTSNYYSQRIYVTSTTVVAGRSNTPNYISNVPSLTGRSLAITNIKLANSGYINYQSNVVSSYGSTGIWINKWYGATVGTSSSITKISVAGATNNIAVGSRYELYKLI